MSFRLSLNVNSVAVSKVKKFEWVNHSKKDEWDDTKPIIHKNKKKYARKKKYKDSWKNEEFPSY